MSKMKEKEEKGTTTSKNSGCLCDAIIQVSLCVFSYAGLCTEFPARSVIQQLSYFISVQLFLFRHPKMH